MPLSERVPLERRRQRRILP